MKKILFGLIFPIPLLFSRPISVQAAGLVNDETTAAIQKMMDGPLTKIIGIALAFLIVTIFVAFIFQILTLSFNPDLPMVRKDTMNNIASLSMMLVGVGVLTTVGFGWLHAIMNGGKEAGAQVLQDGDINVAGWAKMLDQYKSIAAVFFGIVAITMVLAFILQIVKLGSAASNPANRDKAIKGILWTGVSAAMLGGLTIIMTLFINMGSVS